MLWLVTVLFLSMAIAMLRGGRLSNLGDIHLRMWWLLPLGFAMQIAARYIPAQRAFWGVALILASYIPLIVLVILNKERPGPLAGRIRGPDELQRHRPQPGHAGSDRGGRGRIRIRRLVTRSSPRATSTSCSTATRSSPSSPM